MHDGSMRVRHAAEMRRVGGFEASGLTQAARARGVREHG
jgi:hypothetical protein